MCFRSCVKLHEIKLYSLKCFFSSGGEGKQTRRIYSVTDRQEQWRHTAERVMQTARLVSDVVTCAENAGGKSKSNARALRWHGHSKVTKQQNTDRLTSA